MMTSLVISFLAGMVLGQRFKVLVLLPAISLALIAVVGSGIARAEQAWSITLMALGVTVALQLGYLIGTGVRSIVVAARYPRSVPAPVIARRSAH